MTVASETSRVTTAGITAGVPIAVNFPIHAVEDVTVYYSTDVVAVLNTHYTVTLNPPNYLTASITPLAALVSVSGGTITIARRVAFVQTLNLPVNNRIPESGLMRTLDYFCFMAQQVRDDVLRVLKFPSSDTSTNMGALPSATDRAGKFFKFDVGGKPTAVSVLTTGAVAFSAFSESLMALVAATNWRASLQVPGLSVANTYAAAQTLPGNAANPLEAVPKQQAESIATAAAATALPIGAMIHWPTDTPPVGWLVRDGALVSRTTYSALRAAILDGPGFIAANFTVTIASPGLITDNGHGFTGGERLRLSTTGALPTGLNTTDDFFVIVNDVNSYWLATTRENAAAGTKINTSGSQSGTHSRLRSLYGIGDGSTTFKLPDDRGLHERNKPASGSAIGSYLADGNKAHTHTVDYQIGNLAGGAGGNSAGVAVSTFTSGSSGGTEVTVKSIFYLPIIKYQ